jgi:exodeoxyribonuclease-3
MTKIITYNVNGIRAATKKGFMEWLQAADPDIVCIQETKAQPDQIPIFEFEALGYKSYVYSAQKKGSPFCRKSSQIMWNMAWA